MSKIVTEDENGREKKSICRCLFLVGCPPFEVSLKGVSAVYPFDL